MWFNWDMDKTAPPMAIPADNAQEWEIGLADALAGRPFSPRLLFPCTENVDRNGWKLGYSGHYTSGYREGAMILRQRAKRAARSDFRRMR